MGRSGSRMIGARVRALMCGTAFTALAAGGVPPLAMAAGLGQQSGNQIVPDGRTQTVLSGKATNLTITTTSMSGGNAFNSFDTFKEAAGNTVNLVVPTNAAMLLNVVRNGTVNIDGVLNSYKNGRIGGAVLFSDSYGFVVGKSGVVNTGSLTIVTPAPGLNDSLIGAAGLIDDALAARIIRGDVALSSDGSVSIQGRVNAQHGILITAHDIEVAGAPEAAWAMATRRALFASTVNVDGWVQGAALVVQDGAIRIVAADSASLSGKLAVGGPAGSIEVTSGGNLAVASTASFVASAGGTADAGKIRLYAGGDLAVADDANFIAHAAGSGHGGHVELSARQTATIGAMQLDLSSANGANGGLLIDPYALVIGAAPAITGATSDFATSTAILTHGASITLSADSSITVQNGGIIDSRNLGAAGLSLGDSGAITLNAPQITIASGGQVRADAANTTGLGATTFQSGDITFNAVGTTTSSGQGGITLGDTTGGRAIVAGGVLSFLATADLAQKTSHATVAITAADVTASGALTISATASGGETVDEIAAVAGADVLAAVDIQGSAAVSAAGPVTVSALATSTVSATGAIPPVGGLPADASTAVATTMSTARAHIGDQANLTASGGGVTLSAINTVTSNALADASGSGSSAAAGSVAVNVVTVATAASIDGDALVSASGALTLSAQTTVAGGAVSKASATGGASAPAAGGVTSDYLGATSGPGAKYASDEKTSEGGITATGSLSIEDLTSNTAATMTSSREATSGGALSLTTSAQNSGVATADGSADGGGIGIAVGLALNLAHISNDATLSQSVTSGGLALSATTVGGAAGNAFITQANSGAGATDVGVAGALATNLIDSESVARVASGVVTVTGSGSVTVGSDDETSSTVAALPSGTGASGGKVGVGASVALNLVATRSYAGLADGVTLGGAGDVTLAATATHAVSTQADQGSSGGVAVTPVVALALVDDETSATIGVLAGGVLSVAGSVSVTAAQTATEATEASGTAAGGKAAVGAAVAVAVVTDDVTATTGSSVVSSGLLAALPSGTAGDVRFAASGASLSSVSATASASGGNGTADASGDSSGSAAGETPASSGEDSSIDGKVAKLTGSASDKETAGGVGSAVQQSDTAAAEDSETGSKSGGKGDASTSEGSVAVAAAAAVGVSTAKVTAYVPASVSVTTPGTLSIAAVNNTDLLTAADGSQVGSDTTKTKVGVGAAVAVSVVHAAGDATLGSGAGGGIYTVGGLSVTALNTDLGATTPTIPGVAAPAAVVDTALGRPDQFGASATSGAGATNVGVAGSVGVALIDSESVARVASGVVTVTGSGSVTVGSDDETSSTVAALPSGTGASGGKVGVGASVALLTIATRSAAGIADGVTLSGAGALTLKANTLDNTDTESRGGARGGVAIDAVIALAILSETTTATLGSGPASTVGGDVIVRADSAGGNRAIAAGAVDSANKVGDSKGASNSGTSASGAGVGASAAVITGTGIINGVGSGNAITSTTTATIDRDLTTTNGGNLNLAATSARTYDIEASAIAGGAEFDDADPSGGGKSVTADTLGTSQAQGAEGEAQSAMGSGGGGGSGGTKVSVAAALAAGLIGDSVAAEVIGGGADPRTLRVAGSTLVSAGNTGDLVTVGDGVTVSKTSTGIGIGAALSLLANSTTAKIDDNAHLITKGDVAVTATAVENRDPNFDSRLMAQAMSGASGKKIAVAGSLAIAISDSTVAASIGDNVVLDATTDAVTRAGAVTVSAISTNPLSSKAWGGAYSSDGTSVGASIAAVVALDQITADVGDNAQLQAASLNVSAANVKVDAPPTVFGVILTDVEAADYDNARASLITIGTEAMNNALLGESNYYTEALAGAASGDKTAIAGGFSLQLIQNTVRARVADSAELDTTGAITVEAADHTVSKALDGSLAVSLGATSVGVSSTVIADTSSVSATLEGGAVIAHSGSVDVTAASSQSVGLFEVSASVADEISVAGILGAVVLNVGTNAKVGAGGDVTSFGAVKVGATDDVSILNVAGALSGSAETAFGASLIDTTVLNSVGAYVNSNAAARTTVAARSLSVNADLTDQAIDVALAGGAAGENAIVGVATPVTQQSTVLAYVGQNAGLTMGLNGLSVTASDLATVYNIGGTIAVGGQNGIGGAAAVTTFVDTTRAYIDDGSVIDSSGAVNIGATAGETVTAAVVSGSGAGEIGAAVALSSGIVTDTTEAWLGQGMQVGATTQPNGVSVLASDDTTLTDGAGSAGIGGEAGVGAGADVVVLIKNTHAWFGQSGLAAPTVVGSILSSGDVTADAESTQRIQSIVVGLGVGGDAGLAGSATIYSLQGDTRAALGAGDTASADGNVALLANDANTLLRVVGSGAGGGTAGVGASLGVSVDQQTTVASIGDGAVVNALGNTPAIQVTTGFDGVFSPYAGLAAAPTSNFTGATGAEMNPTTVAEAVNEGGSLFLLDRTATPATGSRQGVIVNATSRDAVRSIAVSGAAAGTAAITLSGELPVVVDDTEALVGSGVSINTSGVAGAGQSVSVAAASDIYHVGITGSASAAGTVGFGAGAEINVVLNMTKALVGEHTNIDAARDVAVTANASEDFSGTAATAAVSGEVAVAGGVTAFAVTDTTTASLGASDQVYAAGNVTVAAADETRAVVVAGTLSIGGATAGVGGGVGAAILIKNTTAEISQNARVTGTADVLGDDLTAYDGTGLTNQTQSAGVLVQANSGESVDTLVGAGAGGFFAGVAGVVSVEAVISTTQANIDSGAQINVFHDSGASLLQSVNVTARNSTVLATADGSLGIGAGGVAGTLDLAVITNTTAASIADDARVDAGGDVRVSGLAGLAASSNVVSVGGGVGGIAAAISILAVANGPDPQQTSELQTSKLQTSNNSGSVDGYATNQISDGSMDGLLSGSSNANVVSASASAQGYKSGLSATAELSPSAIPAGVSATVGKAEVNAGGLVSARSVDDLSSDFKGGALAAEIGVGAGIDVTAVNMTNTASLADGAVVSAGSVDISASTSRDFQAYAVAATAAGVAGAATTVGDGSTTTAHLGDAHVVAGGDVNVAASDHISGTLATASLAAGTAGGLVVAVLLPTTHASIGDNAFVNAGNAGGGDVAVSASASESLTTGSAALVVGGLGAGITIVVDKTDTEAAIGDGGEITAGDVLHGTSVGSVRVSAANAASLDSVGAGLAIAGDAGGALSVYTVIATTSALVGDSSLSASGDIFVASNSTTAGNLLVGGAALGGAAGIGGSVGVSVLDTASTAAIADGAKVIAYGLGNGESYITGYQGDFSPYIAGGPQAGAFTEDVGGGSTGAADPTTTDDVATAGKALLTQSRSATAVVPNIVHGVIVNATNADAVRAVSVSGALGGLSAALSANVPVVTVTTTASIGQASVNQNPHFAPGTGQSVSVAAASDAYDLSVVGSAAGGLAAGVGASFSAAVVDTTTKATIAAGAHVDAGDSVAVTAHASEDFATMAASVGVGGLFAINGGLSLIDLDDRTLASIGAGATVTAVNNVAVLADDITRTGTVAGAAALGIGGAGVGGAIGASILTKDTEATIFGSAKVTALGVGTDTTDFYTGFTGKADGHGLLVQANSDESLLTVGIAGSGGLFVGAAGAVSLDILNINTQAAIDDGAQINASNAGAGASQDVRVVARDSVGIVGIDGALGVGLVGFGGSVDVGIVNTNVGASIGDGVMINADGDLAVAVLANKAISSEVLSGAAGVAAIAAGISVYAVGDGVAPGSKSASELQGSSGPNVQDSAGSQLSAGGQVSDSVNATTTNADAQSAAGKVFSHFQTVDVSGLVQAPTPAGTAAHLGAATISAGGQVSITTNDHIDAVQKTGAVAAGAVGAGAGIAVIADSATNGVSLAGSPSSTISGGSITISAVSDHHLTATSLAGAASLIVSVEADAAIASDSSTTTTEITGGAFNATGLVDISAQTTRQIDAHASGAAVAIGGAAGVSYATADADGGAGVTVGSTIVTAGALTVQVGADDETVSDALALAAGLGLAGEGAVSKSSDLPSVTLGLDKATVTATGAVLLSASTSETASASSTGYALAGGVAGGESEADATSSPHVAVSITDGSDIQAASLEVDSLVSPSATGPYVEADASGSTGGFVAINATQSTAINESQATAAVDHSTLSVTGAIAIKAAQITGQRATAVMISVGAVALGDNISKADSNTVTTAILTDLGGLTAGALTLSANSVDNNDAEATAGTGGIIAGAAANASTSTRATTIATTVTDDASPWLIAVIGGAVDISASHVANFTGFVDSTQASLAGLSGSSLTHDVSSQVVAHLGDDTDLRATNLTIDAENHTHNYFRYAGLAGEPVGADPDNAGWDVNSGAGGLFNAAAATAAITVTQITDASIGSSPDVHLLAPVAPGEVSTLLISAHNTAVVHEKSKVDAGGAIELAETDTFITVNDTATAGVGDTGNVLVDIGDIRIAAWGDADLNARSVSTTDGLAGAPTGKAYANYTGANTVAVGGNLRLEATDGLDPTDGSVPSNGTITLAAGEDPYAVLATLDLHTTVDLYNNTVIPIPGTPDAQSNVVSNSNLSVGADTLAYPVSTAHYGINAAGDINLLASKGLIDATAVGTGKNIYLEALSEVASAVSNLFGGGDITFDVHGGTTSVNGAAAADIEGLVDTGLQKDKSLTLSYADAGNAAPGCDVTTTACLAPVAAGSLPTTSTTSTQSDAIILARLDLLQTLILQDGSDPVAKGAYANEINFLELKLVALGLGDLVGGVFTPKHYATIQSPLSIAKAQLVNDTTGLTSVRVGFASATGNLFAPQTAQSVLDQVSQTIIVNGVVTPNTHGVFANTNSLLTSLTGLSGFADADKAAPFMAELALVQGELAQFTGSQPGPYSAIAADRAANVGKQADIAAQVSLINAADPATQQTTILAAQVRLASDLNAINANNTDLQTQLGGASSGLVSQVNLVASQLNDLITAAGGTLTDYTTQFTNLSGASAALSGTFAPQIVTANASTAAQFALLNSTPPGQGQIDGKNSLTQYVGLIDSLSGAIVADNTTILTASDQPPADPTYQVINVSSAAARLGNINVIADHLAGGASGALVAPGQATISITNNTADTLTLDSLSIPSYDAGHLRFNGVLVNSNSEINVLQGGVAAFGVITTALTSLPPSVTITSNYNASDPTFYVPSSPLYALRTAQAPPDIQLNAGHAINNLNGNLTIVSAAGNIYVDGVINAGSVNILARNGDFVAAYVDGANHVGGDPAGFTHPDTGAILSGDPANAVGDGLGITANGAVSISARYLDINSTIQSGIAQWTANLPAAPLLTAHNPGDIGVSVTAIAAAQATYVSNQAGDPNTSPLIPVTNSDNVSFNYNAKTGQLEFSTGVAAEYVSAHPAGAGLYTVIDTGGNIAVAYDTHNTRYVVDDTEVHGGYVQLFGQIMNTSPGAGQINVLDGYGTINIVNNTGLTVVLAGLSTGVDPSGTGRGVAGVIDITDVTRVDATTSPLVPVVDITHTVYTRNVSVQVQSQTGHIDQKTGAAIYDAALSSVATQGGIVGSSAYVDASRSSQYDPTEYQRYVFSTATNLDETIYAVAHQENIFGGGGITISSNTSFASVNAPTIISGPTNLVNGSYTTSGALGVTLTGITVKNSGIITEYTSPDGSGSSTQTLGPAFINNQDIESKSIVTSEISYVNNRSSAGYAVQGGSWTDCNWWTLCADSDKYTPYTIDQKYTTITTNSLKADYPIAINFIGSNTGAVNVSSAANVVLTGNITNKGGVTSLCAGAACGSGFVAAATPASIIQGSTSAVITSKSVVLIAAGSVGGVTDISNPAAPVAAPITIALAQVLDPVTQIAQPPAGFVSASADNGVVNLAARGDLRIETATASGDATKHLGSITLTAGGSIVGNDTSASITADSVSLKAANGVIGGSVTGAPLAVNTGYTSDQTYRPFGDPATTTGVDYNPFYGLTASAQGDINIAARKWADSADGTILANTILSRGGNVTLSTPGQILDNEPIQSIDSRTYAQLLNYWNSLALTGPAAVAKGLATVAAFDVAQTADYRQYWQIRMTQADGGVTYDPNFVVVIKPGSAQYNTFSAYYSAQNPGVPVDPEILAFADQQTAHYRALQAEVGGYTTTFDSAFAYQATSMQSDQLTRGSVWTEKELAFSIAAGALKTVTNTNPVIKAANVSGISVTLAAGQGIGETVIGTNQQPGVLILADTAPSVLTNAQKIALAAAERSDLQLTISGELTLTPAQLATLKPAELAAYNAAQGLGAVTIALGDNPSAFTANQKALLLAAADGFADPHNTYLTVLTKRPLNFDSVAALNFTVSTQPDGTLDIGDAYLASRGSVPLGTVSVHGETRIKVLGSITNAATGSSIGTGNLILEAAQGSVGSAPAHDGTASAALVINPNAGATVSARAGQGIDLFSQNRLNIDTVYSPGNITLGALDDLTNANNDLLINVLGTDVRLTSGSGSIGAVPDRLNVGVNLGGAVYAIAARAVDLYGADADNFIVGSISAGTTVDLSASLDGTIAGPLQATGEIRFAAAGRWGLTGAANVDSLTGDISINANSLKIVDGGRVDAESGHVIIVTAGDALVTGLHAGASDGLAVSITAGGHVLAGADPARFADITDTAPIGGVFIQAGLGIGNLTEADSEAFDGPGEAPGTADQFTTVANGLRISTPAQILGSANGSINVTALTPLLSAIVDAQAGDINLHALADLQGVRILAEKGSINVLGDGSLSLDSLTASGSIGASAATILSVGKATSGGTQTLSGQTGVTYASLTTIGIPGDPGDIDIASADGPVNGRTTTAAGSVNIAALGATLDTVTSGGSTKITTANDLTLSSLTTGGSGALTGGGVVNLGTATDGSSLAVVSTADAVTIGTATSGGTQTISGQTGVTYVSLTTTGLSGDPGDIDVVSVDGPVSGTTTTAAGSVNIAALSAILDTVASGGSTTVTTANDLTLSSLTTGGSGALTGGGVVNLGTATDASTLGVVSTRDAVTIGTAISGGTQTISGQTGVTYASLTTTGAPGDPGDIDIVSVGGPVNGTTTTAAGSVNIAALSATLDTVTSGGSTKITTADDLTLASLTTGGSGALTGGGVVNLGTATDGGSLAVVSTADAVTIGTATSGGTQTISGQTGVTYVSLTTTGLSGDPGDIDVVSVDGPVSGTTTTAAGSVNIAALSAILDTVASGGSTTVTTANDLTLSSLTTGGSGALTGGGVVNLGTATDASTLGVVSTRDAVTIGTAISGGTQTISGQTGVTYASLTTTGIPGDEGDIDITSAAGPITGRTAHAHGRFSASGVGLYFGDVTGDLAVTLVSDGPLTADAVTTFGLADLSASGTIDLGTLTAADARITTPGLLRLQTLTATSTLDLATGDIWIGTLRQASAATQPLVLTITGYKGAVGRTATLTIDAPLGIVMPKFYEDVAVIDTNAGNIDIRDADITSTFRLRTPSENTFVDDLLSSPKLGSNIQLFALTDRFFFKEVGNVITTSAYVVRYDTTPWVLDDLFNRVYIGASFVRDFDRMHRVGDEDLFSTSGSPDDVGVSTEPLDDFDIMLDRLSRAPITPQGGRPAVNLNAPTPVAVSQAEPRQLATRQNR